MLGLNDHKSGRAGAISARWLTKRNSQTPYLVHTQFCVLHCFRLAMDICTKWAHIRQQIVGHHDMSTQSRNVRFWRIWWRVRDGLISSPVESLS